MKRLAVLVSGIGVCASAQAYVAGADFIHTWDSEQNNMNRVTVSGWFDVPGVSRDNKVYSDNKNDHYDLGDVKIDNNLVKVATQKSGEYAGAGIDLKPAIDMTGKTLHFKVRVDNWRAVKDFVIIFADAGNLENSVTVDLKNHIKRPPNGEWIEVAVPVSNLEVWGKPNLAKISRMLWRIRDDGSQRVASELTDVKLTNTGTKPYVSITVDDGETSTVKFQQIMSRYGLKGGIYIDPDMIGRRGYITQSQVDSIAAAGWDISGHEVNTNMRAATESEAVAEISKTKKYLASHNYTGADVFAYPNSNSSEKVRAGVTKNFSYALNVNGWSNPTVDINPQQINRISVDRWTTVEQVEGWVNDAKKNNEWLVLNFHTLDTSGDDDWSSANFIKLCEYLKAQGIDVQPVSQVLSSVSKTETKKNLAWRNKNIVASEFAAEQEEIQYMDVSESEWIANDLTVNRDFGVAVTNAVYTNPSTGLFTSTGGLLRANYKRGDWALLGDAGASTIAQTGKTYFLGDMNGLYFVNENFALTAGTYGDIVDSPNGLALGITQTGYTAGFDAYNSWGGVSVQGRQGFFSDTNVQSGFYGKVYGNVLDWATVYFSTKQYQNSQPWSPNYYSPEQYARYNAGLSAKYDFGRFVVTGYGELGQQWDGSWSSASAGRLNIDTKPDRGWSMGGTIGTDISANNGYRYNYLIGRVKYNF